MPNEVIEFIKNARRVSTPFLAISTSDQIATVQTIKAEFETPKEKENKSICGPVVVWDVLRGFYGQGEKGEIVCSQMSPKPESFAGSPHKAIAACGDLKFLPSLSYLIIVNADKIIENVTVVQAIMNVRTHFTKNQKQLILLGPDITFPTAIMHDFITMDEELPTAEEHKELTKRLCTANKIELPDLDKASSALKGLTLFGAEQVVSMSSGANNGKRIVDLKKLWKHKKDLIENTPGLKMIDWSDITFDKVGGLTSIKTFFTRLFSGPRAPKVLMKVDEIEKMFGGLSGAGDNTGITQDMLGFLLKFMENHKHSGSIMEGPPGTGKTYLAEAVASTFRVPFLEAEFGETIDSKAGASQQRFKSLLSTVQAIAGDGGCYIYATANKDNLLPPELKRRFRYGVYFFDLPDEEEKISIAGVQASRFNIDIKEAQEFFRKIEGISGANIRDTLELSVALQCPLAEAFTMVIPAEVQDREGIEALRKRASNRFLSAAYPGVYKMQKGSDDTSVRRIEL